jgi:hypothetical protein
VTDVDLEKGFLVLDYPSTKSRTEHKWSLIGDLADLMTSQIAAIRRDERKLRCEIRWLLIAREIGFHRARFMIPGELQLKGLVIRGNCCTTFVELLRDA